MILVLDLFFALEFGPVRLECLFLIDLGHQCILLFFLLLENVVLELLWVLLHLPLEGVDVLRGPSVLGSDLVENFPDHFKRINVLDLILLTVQVLLSSFLNLFEVGLVVVIVVDTTTV